MQNCPQCKIELRIGSSHYEVAGDKSASTPTQLYRITKKVCRNPQCASFEQVVETVKTPIEIGEF
jgi:hypothetical protein